MNARISCATSVFIVDAQGYLSAGNVVTIVGDGKYEIVTMANSAIGLGESSET